MRALGAVPWLLPLLATTALAFGSGELPAPATKPDTATAVARYNEGVAFTAKGDWPKAEAAYHEAVMRKPDFPEAWNGLGHALKMQRRFDDAVRAYQRALALRPGYAQAMEYLGETYVAMGKLGEARTLLARLEPLDASLAALLRRAIAQGGSAAW
ncbi:MAG TPA: tetratricopeptide repeat protein [Candidatus Binatia bacterium]|nr:tetratricopeptide repeat protein [Candidatus Binatia bacterium]